MSDYQLVTKYVHLTIFNHTLLKYVKKEKLPTFTLVSTTTFYHITSY